MCWVADLQLAVIRVGRGLKEAQRRMSRSMGTLPLEEIIWIGLLCSEMTSHI